MKKSITHGIIRGLAILATGLVLPVWLSAQSSSIPALQPTGPLAVVDAPASSELPPAPDAAVTTDARQPLTNGMFAIRAVEVPAPRHEPGAYRFWDRENSTLFAVSAGWATADFFVTRSNLASGGREMNPVARVFAGSTPGLAANFALETGGVMGISYIFHKTRHHKLERMTSYVNISASAGAVLYGLTHR